MGLSTEEPTGGTVTATADPGSPPVPGRRPGRAPRIFYAAGPGDVIETYRHWRGGRDDPSQVSSTYSGQFYDLCRDLGAVAHVISGHPRAEVLKDGAFRIEHRPDPSKKSGGLVYHLGQARRVLGLAASALRFRADVAVVGGIDHWFLLRPLTALGVEVVPTLHCAFWPATHPPSGRVQRWLAGLNGRFFRRASAAICVSPECERQLRILAGDLRGPVLQCRAQYRREAFAAVPPPPPASARPFRVMFAGRIERNKGVFDLLRSAVELDRARPGFVTWEVCGTGGAEGELRDAVEAAGLGGSFRMLGRLDRPEMLAAYGRSHVVVVPTTSGFAEGLNKVAVEAVMAGRPPITSVLSNACDVLGGAVVEVPPDDPAACGAAILRLAADPALYERACRASLEVRDQFLDPGRGWGAALDRIVRGLPPLRDAEVRG